MPTASLFCRSATEAPPFESARWPIYTHYAAPKMKSPSPITDITNYINITYPRIQHTLNSFSLIQLSHITHSLHHTHVRPAHVNSSRALGEMATLTNWILSQNADYVYPIAVNLFVSLLPAWMAFKVGGARRRTGLKYPLEYHPGVIDEKTDNDKYLFNCTQRASQVLPLVPCPCSLVSAIYSAFCDFGFMSSSDARTLWKVSPAF